MLTVKKLITYIAASLLGLSSFALFAAGSHDGNHDEEIAFDAVNEEFGAYEPGMKPTRTIEVEMGDQMRFIPDVITVKKGEVVKFVNKNNGKLMHEFVLGTAESLAEHAAMMQKFPGMEHSEPYMSHIAPNESGEMLWKFSEAGEYAFGCLVPGHYEAGMKGKVIVES